MKMKKLLTMAMAAVMVFAFSTMAMAAGLSADEQKLLDKVKAGYDLGDSTLTVSAEYINQFQAYLEKNEVTAENLTKIENYINDSVAVVKAAGVTSIDKLTAADKEKIINNMDKAAAVENLDFNISSDGDIVIKDTTGATVFEADATAKITKDATSGSSASGTGNKGVVKKTGFGLEATATIVAMLSVIVGAAFVISKRRETV